MAGGIQKIDEVMKIVFKKNLFSDSMITPFTDPSER
jgi:hypothetical protein